MAANEPKLSPGDLGIDLGSGDPDQLYRWFLASLLFGKRIQQDIAARTWRVLIDNGLTNPGSFSSVSRERLMELLTEGGYVHYRWKEDDELHSVMAGIIRRYGSLEQMVKGAGSAGELRERLEGFKGIGPVTANIFMEWVPRQYNGTYSP
ncbi:DNA methylase [Arthrobacter sp. Sa2CUA1]|uniref:DNA methylase n=1 Tax=Arthrobacter gallicola TaxID=2762225 RepID=A0ABR8UWL8_9MICC|nr:DNA methylase [Arthrobacter gallicola]MBD7996782.1 DNA methylase [Arthrobacter gallicola]